MITISFQKIIPKDVDDLQSLSLNMAFAIHVFGWKWYKRSADNMPFCLLDSKPQRDRKLNDEYFRHIGDGRYVAKSLPKFDTRLKSMIDLTTSLETKQQQRRYMEWLEDEVGSADHFVLTTTGAEKRCRAFLKMVLDEKIKSAQEIKKEEKAEAA